MERILILDADQQFAAELERALRVQYTQEAATAATVREACLHLAQQPYDLAFVPYEDLDNVIHALHSLQPDLPLILLIAEKDSSISGDFPEAVKGTLVKTELARMLASLMYSVGQSLSPSPTNGKVGAAHKGQAGSAAEPVAEETPPAEELATETPQTDMPAAEPAGDIQSFLKQITGQDKVLGAMISLQDRLLAHNGMLDETQAETIRRRITTTWRPNNSALIQFMRLPERSGDLLLYTRPIRGDYLLTVAAVPDHPVGDLRRQTDEPVRRLSSLVHGEARATSQSAVVATNRVRTADSGDGPSYALVWRPRQPMPGMLQIALRRVLERIAQANECHLRHLIVDAELVHVVVHCSGGQTAARIAHLFKHDAEKEIQQQFGVPAQLWEKGYYATESDEPLSQVELNLFLSSRAKGNG